MHDIRNLFLFLFIFIQYIHAFQNNSLIHYDTASFPCDTECAALSSGECFPSIWSAAAELTRKVTKDCEYVLYSVSLGHEVGDLYETKDFWNGQPCTLMFLSENSTLVNRINAKSLDTYNGWTLILVGNFDDWPSLRRAGKIPKLAPNMFFTETTKYAMYLDSKFKLSWTPKQIIEKFALLNANILITALGHPKNRDLKMEVNNICESRKKRPTLTDNIDKVLEQFQNYTENPVIKELEEQSLPQNVVEAGMLVHKLHDARGNIFRCAWLEQVQLFSDRDQVAFPFVAAYFNELRPKYMINDVNILPLNFPRARAFIAILPFTYAWTNGASKERLGDVAYQPWHQEVEFHHSGHHGVSGHHSEHSS